MEISRSKKNSAPPDMQLSETGRIVFNKKLAELLEIENLLDGVQFGYKNSAAYIAYCGEHDRHVGNFHTDGRFRLNAKAEVLRISKVLGIKDLPAFVQVDVEDFEIHEGVKFYKLKIHESKTKTGS